ncbi:hypothetical protein [Streptomyces zagrosensis]|uniref:ADP-ribose pyrophosphatase YjhB (NUDIX family) n=1 Tax=Streptomyces zagrosensis TaxID=1042984 RepID=A0A7W9QAT6_9ACTN|nr:hypothetical protein [Streptomyces zagrosensis]MBB5936726.1 ADP-ribose pyrophosphatase YjhB (NUDIX family) [Streptomyces zagrosensis]
MMRLTQLAGERDGVGTADRRSIVLTWQHTVRVADGTVLRFFLTDADPCEPAMGWKPATDIEFQHAYENALFDPKALAAGELCANTHRIQIPLDALAGTGGFFWSDGAHTAGIMTTNGKAPEDCELHLAHVPGPQVIPGAPHVRVSLLVWKPLDPEAPGDTTRGLPQVLQIREGTTPWQVPGVILRPGELLLSAAARAAYAVGLELPNHHRVLATDFRRPEHMTLVVDGGWVSGADARTADGHFSSCRCHAEPHSRRWAAWTELDDVMTRALHAAVTIPLGKENR